MTTETTKPPRNPQKPADLIVEAIHGMRMRFEVAGLKAPTVLLLNDHEDGMRLLALLSDAHHFIYDPKGRTASPIEHPDGSVWMQINLMEMAIRWPARPMALPGSRFLWT